MSIELGILISISSVFIAGLGLVVAYLSYQNKRHQHTISETEESAELKTSVEYIRKGVDEIRIDLRSNRKELNTISQRLTRVEESSKQAHHRIDDLEGNKNKSNRRK